MEQDPIIQKETPEGTQPVSPSFGGGTGEASTGEASTGEAFIIADADHLDRVAADMSAHFERMLGRRIPRADLARWTECLAQDGGLREGDHLTQVVLVHRAATKALDHFVPSSFATEIDGQAFKGPLGEFVFSAPQTEPDVGGADLLCDALALALEQPGTKHIMVVPDEADYDRVSQLLQDAPADRHVTVFAMQPMPEGRFQQDILGYSLMAALGIRGEEV